MKAPEDTGGSMHIRKLFDFTNGAGINTCLIFFILLLTITLFGFIRPLIEGNKIRIMFYNTENLFDIYNDPETDDDEFLPEGIRRWNSARYIQKLNLIYKVVVAAGEGELPAIIGLCEVENRRVIEDLLRLTPLNLDNNYRILHEDSNDPRGIDVCLIYRDDIIQLLKYSYYFPDYLRESGFKTRSVLYSEWIWRSDTVHLFLNHWPSRRGGVLATEKSRIAFAEMLKYLGDSISNSSGDCSKIIFAGDFNCNPSGNEMKILTSGESKSYINISGYLAEKKEGTYRYNGIWQMFDQIVVSNSLLSCKKGIYTNRENIKIIKPELLLSKDNKYPGNKPFSTYNGYRYQGGFSDHLPVILDLFYADNQ